MLSQTIIYSTKGWDIYKSRNVEYYLGNRSSKLTWLWLIILRVIPGLNNLRKFAKICQQSFPHYLN